MFSDGTAMHHENDPEADENGDLAEVQADEAGGFVTDFMSGDSPDETS